MRVLQRLVRGRSALRNRQTSKSSSLRLTFERLENRCLMSSGFDSGIATADNLRSPLHDGDAKRQISIRRFSADLHFKRGALDSQRDDAFRIIYDDGEQTEIRVTERRLDSLRSDRAGVPTRRPDDPERRTEKNQSKNTETERRVGVLDVVGRDAANTDREPVVVETDNRPIRSEFTVLPDRQKQAPVWRPEPHVPGAPSWDRNRLDEWFGFESGARTRNPCKTERESSDEVNASDALSTGQLAAFHACEAGAGGENGFIDADVLAAEMMLKNEIETTRPGYGELEAARFVEAWDQTLYLAAVDCALLTVLEGQITNTCPTAQTPTGPQLGPVTAQNDEQMQVSMAAAAAVLIASRVESRRSPTRKRRGSRGLGWLGAVAQFLVTPRFTTPRRPTILLAMGDDLVREGFARVLRDDGYDVVDFGTLSEAAKHVTANWITLDGAVMDSELDFSGIHLFTKIREKYPKLPVVVCGEAADHGDMIQYRRLGARRCLLKPVELSELLATVNALVW